MAPRQQPGQPASGDHRQRRADGSGAFTLSRTPVDVFPDLNKPTVTIATGPAAWPPRRIEQLITFPLETTMSGLPGVEAVRSTSSAGLSFLYVTFDWSTDIFRAASSSPSGWPRWKEGLAEGVVPRMGPSARSWARSCRSPFRSIREDQPDGGARVRRLGASPAAALGAGRRAGDPDRRRGAAVPGAADTARMAELASSHDQLEAAPGASANTSGGFRTERPRVPESAISAAHRAWTT